MRERSARQLPVLAASILAAGLLFNCGGDESHSKNTLRDEQNASAAPTVPNDPIAALDRADLPPLRRAELCEASRGRLNKLQRQRCSEAHIKAAMTFLDQKDYTRARNALVFAETEGVPLGEVRSLRRKILGYQQATAGSRSAPDAAANPPSEAAARAIRGSAANRLTIAFASSRLEGFDIRAAAAGKNCDILLVTFYVSMEDPMIRAMHDGALIYGQILPGGVSAFANQYGFRGVVYRDGYDRTWSYGNVARGEATSAKRCFS
jgi:hypothetical protein